MNQANPRIWTVGHSNRTAEELLALLKEHGIELLLDVRSSPWSRRHPCFCKDELESALTAAGLSYRWLGSSLGGLRPEGYDEHRKTAEYQQGLDEVAAALDAPAVLFCAERDYRQCHRRWISEDLAARGVRVWHVIDPGVVAPHQLSLGLDPEL